ncbi:glucosaminidase domain-containing protein [Sporosarcina sp. FSL W7-1349]|uniref:glucosaminidase domain-containing protein n=1 Tax=Sporosarcina sp. FSL W7-1349 TaxID=2921561 RepID=UPI0030F89EE8
MTAFIEQLALYAIKHGRANGVLPSLILSQACLGSSFGTSEVAVHANNLIGIKAGSGWIGPIHTKRTTEHMPNEEIKYNYADFK